MCKKIILFGLCAVLIAGCAKKIRPPELDTLNKPVWPTDFKTIPELKTVYFEYDKYEIKPDQGGVLAKNAEFLKKNPGLEIRVEGHCDERGTTEYNLALGDRRANSAKEYYSHLRIDAARIETTSYGEEKPFDPGHTEEAWAKNRRAETLIRMK